MKNITLYRLAGISGIILGSYLIHLKNSWGSLAIAIGIGVLFWRFE